MADKLDWMSRLRKCMGSAPKEPEGKEGSKKGSNMKTSSSAPSLTETNSKASDNALVCLFVSSPNG